MICCNCTETLQAETLQTHDLCPHCHRDPRLLGRYRLQRVLGSGAQATTYLATRSDGAASVAIKELLIRKVARAKALELFQREARVLRQLDHPSIPAYVEHFEAGEGTQVGLYLVQRFVDGDNLAVERLEHRFDERELCAFLVPMLDLLAYLARLRPPVVHRDIKPSNIVRERDSGRLVLVDFGSVRAALDSELGGSTVAGTFGYMAPEQLMGRASPASDIYALGATAVALLSGRDPDELYDSRRRIPVDELVVDAGLRHALRAMLRADPERRPDDPAALARHFEDLLAGKPDALLPLDERRLTPLPPAPRSIPATFLRDHGVEARFKIVFGGVFAGSGGIGTLLALVLSMRGSGLPLPLLLLVLAGALGLFGGVGGGLLRSGLRLRARLQRLFATGHIVVGEVARIEPTGYSSNGRRPQRVHYTYAVERRSYTGHHDVDADRAVAKGDEVLVLLDPQDPRSSMLWLDAGGPA